MSIIHNTSKALLDFLLPQRCILCSKETVNGLLCNNCLDYLPLPRSPLCLKCGRPIRKYGLCRYCHKKTHLDYGRSLMVFVPPADKIIHNFKYRKLTVLARFLGRAMATLIRTDHYLKNAEMIIPVPLFWWKYLKRGYNQAALLVDNINLEANITNSKVLKRIKHTKSQTKLSENARIKNILNAFQVKQNGIQGKRVMLVDDVMTTGVTINECAKVLKRAGANKVYSCVAAITPG